MITPYVDNVVNFCGFAFFESMLEPHARQAAGMSPEDVRNIFVINGAVYFAGMLLAGYVSEEKEQHICLSLFLRNSGRPVIVSRIR